MTAAGMLAMAKQLLARADADTAGVWPRAAALLARQALEQGLDAYWSERGMPLQFFGTRQQLICLREYIGDDVLAGRACHAWSSLTRACHHHPYELPPGHAELERSLEIVSEALAATRAR
jgi:hypothetical protein